MLQERQDFIQSRFQVGDPVVIFTQTFPESGVIEFHNEGEVVALATGGLIKIRKRWLFGTTEEWYQENSPQYLFARVTEQ